MSWEGEERIIGLHFETLRKAFHDKRVRWGASSQSESRISVLLTLTLVPPLRPTLSARLKEKSEIYWSFKSSLHFFLLHRIKSIKIKINVRSDILILLFSLKPRDSRFFCVLCVLQQLNPANRAGEPHFALFFRLEFFGSYKRRRWTHNTIQQQKSFNEIQQYWAAVFCAMR